MALGHRRIVLQNTPPCVPVGGAKLAADILKLCGLEYARQNMLAYDILAVESGGCFVVGAPHRLEMATGAAGLMVTDSPLPLLLEAVAGDRRGSSS